MFAICVPDADVVLILFSSLFLSGSPSPLVAGVMSFKERRLANGSLGFITGSPSLDMHLWAVRCGYVDGPRLIRMGPGFVSMLAWFATLVIRVVVQAFRVCAESGEGVSQDCDMLKALVGSVLSGELTKGSLNSRFPQFGTVLFLMILSDLASPRGH